MEVREAKGVCGDPCASGKGGDKFYLQTKAQFQLLQLERESDQFPRMPCVSVLSQ